MRDDVRALRQVGAWAAFDPRNWEKWTANGVQPLSCSYEDAVRAGRALAEEIKAGRRGRSRAERIEALREQCRSYHLPPRGAEMVVGWTEDRLRAVFHGRPVADFVLGHGPEVVRGTTYGPAVFALAEKALKLEGVSGKTVDDARKFFADPRTAQFYDPAKRCIAGPEGVVAIVAGTVPPEVGRQMAAGPAAASLLVGALAAFEVGVEKARACKAPQGAELLPRVPELEPVVARIRALKAWMQCGLPGPERPGLEPSWREGPPGHVLRVRGTPEEHARLAAKAQARAPEKAPERAPDRGPGRLPGRGSGPQRGRDGGMVR